MGALTQESVDGHPEKMSSELGYRPSVSSCPNLVEDDDGEHGSGTRADDGCRQSGLVGGSCPNSVEDDDGEHKAQNGYPNSVTG